MGRLTLAALLLAAPAAAGPLARRAAPPRRAALGAMPLSVSRAAAGEARTIVFHAVGDRPEAWAYRQDGRGRRAFLAHGRRVVEGARERLAAIESRDGVPLPGARGELEALWRRIQSDAAALRDF